MRNGDKDLGGCTGGKKKKRKNISGCVLERRILKEGAQAVRAGTPTEEQQLKQSEGN